MEYLGKVFLDSDKDISIRWLEDKKPDIKEGDVLILKFRDIEILQITIGSLEDITQPVMIEWLTREIGPVKDSGFVCKVYKRSVK